MNKIKSVQDLREDERKLLPDSNLGNLPGVEYKLRPDIGWCYLLEKDFRRYQFEIVKTALTQNTLVAIPTGLGKTHIAATVMLNYYLWYPEGIIAFLAPTRPLVEQQAESIKSSLNLDERAIAVLTGSVPSTKRPKLYREASIFFMTPQILEKDIKKERIDPKSIVLLVIDEAHRGQGNYAYCNIVKQLDSFQFGYRILALSATPASQIDAVQEIITNLNISKIEVRTEEDPDVAPYMHAKDTSIVRVQQNDNIKSLNRQIDTLLGNLAKPLAKLGQFAWDFVHNPERINKTKVLDVMNKLRVNKDSLMSEIGGGNISECYGNLGVMMSLLESRVQLCQHGISSFKNFIENFQNLKNNKQKNNSLRVKKKLMETEEFKTMLKELQEEADNGEEHSKLIELKKILTDHFEASPESRCIIFTQYRSSAAAIKEYLQQELENAINCEVFVGQSSGGGVRGMVQKQQLQVMEWFKRGAINCLISTSVGEEGLDIGEVELIVCYDSNSNPTRTIQRMGRTGRKKDGKVIVLSVGNNEDTKYKTSINKNKQLIRFLRSNNGCIKLYNNNPRMIPLEISHLMLSEKPARITPKKTVQRKITRFVKKKNTENPLPIPGFITAKQLVDNQVLAPKTPVSDSAQASEVTDEIRSAAKELDISEDILLEFLNTPNEISDCLKRGLESQESDMPVKKLKYERC
jgi:ERCC4-related helicase